MVVINKAVPKELVEGCSEKDGNSIKEKHEPENVEVDFPQYLQRCQTHDYVLSPCGRRDAGSVQF